MRSRPVPLWLMGLANSTYGMYAGIVAIAMPQILSARRVPESTIAGITAAAMSPGFWTFIVSPVLDVRFSRRWYSLVTALATAGMVVAAILNLDHPLALELLLLLGFFLANLNQSAYGGWLSSIIPPSRQSELSIWVTIGNVGATGVMGLIASQLVLEVSAVAAAAVLGVISVLPILVYPWMPAPGPDRRLASESFGQFFGEILRLVRRGPVIIALVLLALPMGTFSLTNFLPGLGDAFAASPRYVSLIAGAGVTGGAIVGCLLFRVVKAMLPLRPLYLLVGALGAVLTLAMIPLPHTPTAFALALVTENVFQGLAITISIAIAFDTIGAANPLAATTYCLIISAYNVPITYMLLVDGWGYSHGGVAGSYLADALAGLITSALMALVLLRAGSRAA